jgi:hypothetical protein
MFGEQYDVSELDTNAKMVEVVSIKQVFKLKQNGLFNLEVDDQSKIYEILSSMKHSLEDFIRHNW